MSASKKTQPKKLWGGRFRGKTHPLMERLGVSVHFDCRLAPYDIRAGIAHARMLGRCGILSRKDSDTIVRGLQGLLREVEEGRIQWDPTLEDVHTNIEALLVQRIGETGKRLHTGRSRNDQVATDVRLWARDATDRIVEWLRAVQKALLDLAEEHVETIVPGHTHFQPAQPVTFGHHCLAYVEMFQRDIERFTETRRRINILPLGSAALAGTGFPIDRHGVAKELGFTAVSENSMDAVSDRDFLVEFCSNCALVMVHLSRLSEELIIWSHPSFDFVELPDSFTTGSSLMPQKKNPDAAELTRGKAGRVFGNLTALLTLLKGLPLAYNRDLQEDKEAAFDSADTVELCLAVFAAMLPGIEVKPDRMREAAEKGYMEATDLADYLVERGVPFRESHEVVGNLVLYALQHNKRLSELSLEEYRRFHERFDADVFQRLRPETLVRRRDHVGGTAPRRVRAALRRARARLKPKKT